MGSKRQLVSGDLKESVTALRSNALIAKEQSVPVTGPMS